MSLPVIETPGQAAACFAGPPSGPEGATPQRRPGQTVLLLAGGLAAWVAAYAAVRPLSEWLAFQVLGLAPASHLGQSVAFFLYDAPKVLLLLALVVFAVGIVRSFFTPERTRALLAGRSTPGAIEGLLRGRTACAPLRSLAGRSRLATDGRCAGW